MRKSKVRNRVIKSSILIISLLSITLFFMTKKGEHQGKNVIQPRTNLLETIQTNDHGLIYYATDLNVNTTDKNKMIQNTNYLQDLVDRVSEAGGGIVHIPAGIYYFEPIRKNEANVEYYIIKCRDNVLIQGEGTNETNGTVLKPYGTLELPIDMFYYNELRDSNLQNAKYLVNADFRNFMIDGKNATSTIYNTGGKGFMINLYKDCDWENVVVKNTDGTGFGMDNPINCTINQCIAIGCGKGGTSESQGASGFGIGTGYSEEESIYISNSTAIGNRKYGFFFEHQSRFTAAYKAKKADGFVVTNCVASSNQYNFGGERANDVTYENCRSYSSRTTDENPLKITCRDAVHFGSNSRRTHMIDCQINQNFSDVSQSSSYYNAINWAISKGITPIDNYSINQFNPGRTMSRAEALDLLWKMAERPGDVVITRTITGETGYADVAINSKYADSVIWGRKENIISEATNFNPDTNCTRGAFITMLWRYAGAPVVETKNNFNDVPEGQWYEKAVNWALEKEIIFNTNGAFSANGTYTRGDIVTMLHRYSNGKNRFSISYNLMGGKVATTNRTSYEGKKDTFTLNNPTKTGYRFIGWSGSNGLEKNQTVTIGTNDSGHKTYVANWIPNEYIVSFNSNSGAGQMENQHFTYNVSQVLYPNQFTKNGYEFNGWNTKQDGTGKTYQNANAALNLTSKSDGKVVLYAQWKKADSQNRKNIFIGESSFVEMRNIMGTGDIYSAGRGQGIAWLKSTGIPAIEDQIKENTNVIIRIGSNDLFNLQLDNGKVNVDKVADGHRKYFNAKAVEWIQAGANVYYVSLGPADDTKIDSTNRKVNNTDLAKFNETIQTQLRGITFIDTYSLLIEDINKKNPDFTREDGTHGTAIFYAKMYHEIKKKIGQNSIPIYEAQKNMSDIDRTSPYYLPVKWAYENVYINPTSGNTFSPDSTCTRANAIGLLWRSKGIPYVQNTTGVKFPDVDTNSIYYDAFMWGSQMKIVSGSGGAALPNATCSRADFITFLWRMDGNKKVSHTNPFTDVPEGEYYTDAIKWAVDKKIIKQNSTTFLPRSGCTRAEAVTFLYRYYNQDLIDTYTVTYDGTENGGTAVSPEIKNINSGDDVDLSITSTKNGYEFIGWNTNKDATKGLTSLTAGTENIILYAIFKKDIRLTFIDYKENQPVEAVKNITIYNKNESQIVTIPKINEIKEGYTFKGWNTKRDGTGISYQVGDKIAFAKDTILYAKWQKDTEEEQNYTVTYNFSENGGNSADKTNESVDTGASVNLDINAYKTGYEFIGWNTNKDATEGLRNLTVGTEDIILYAIFKKDISLTFTDYKENTQSQTVKTVTIYNKGTAQVIAPKINEYTGWTERYWTKGSTADAPKIVDSEGIISDVVNSENYYARYTKRITVEFNINEGIGNTPQKIEERLEVNSRNIEAVKKAEIVLPNIEVEKEGFIATTWNTKADGTGIDYMPNKIGEFLQDTVLYTKWRENSNEDIPNVIIEYKKEQNWTNEDILLSITVTDSISEIEEVKINGEDISKNTEKKYQYMIKQNGTYYIEVKNKAGNIVRKEITVSRIDKSKPVISEIINSSQGQVANDEAEVTIKILEEHSGIAKVEYSFDQKNWKDCLEESNQKEFVVTNYDYKVGESKILTKWIKSIDTTVYFRVTDEAGNMSEIMPTVIKVQKKNHTSSDDNDTEDKQHKDKEQNDNKDDVTIKKKPIVDNTTSDRKLPQTGSKNYITLIGIILLCAILGIIFVKKYRLLKDIK